MQRRNVFNLSTSSTIIINNLDNSKKSTKLSNTKPTITSKNKKNCKIIYKTYNKNNTTMITNASNYTKIYKNPNKIVWTFRKSFKTTTLNLVTCKNYLNKLKETCQKLFMFSLHSSIDLVD